MICISSLIMSMQQCQKIVVLTEEFSFAGNDKINDREWYIWILCPDEEYLNEMGKLFMPMHWHLKRRTKTQ
jgi:hypothetical protein